MSHWGWELHKLLLVANHVQESVAHNGQEAVPGAGSRVRECRESSPGQRFADWDWAPEHESSAGSLDFYFAWSLIPFQGAGRIVDVPPHALSSGLREEKKSIFYTKKLVIESWPASAATHTDTPHTHTDTHTCHLRRRRWLSFILGKCLDRLCLGEPCMMAWQAAAEVVVVVAAVVADPAVWPQCALSSVWVMNPFAS